jgi:hypothetical protein
MIFIEDQLPFLMEFLNRQGKMRANSEIVLSDMLGAEEFPWLIGQEEIIVANGLMVAIRPGRMQIHSGDADGVEFSTSLQVSHFKETAYYPHAGGYTTFVRDEAGALVCEPLVVFGQLPEGATIMHGDI